MVASVLNAAILYSNAGPFAGASFNYNPHAIWGQTFSARSNVLNYIEFDLDVVQHGTPSGSPFYSVEIRVLDLSTGTVHSTSYPGGTSSSIHISTTLSVPSGVSYNITVRVSNNQSPSFSNYWEAVVTDIVVSN